jgi:hypothetical protein
MPQEICSDEVFIKTWNQYRSTKKVSEFLGMSERRVNNRRRSLEEKRNIVLQADDSRGLKYQKNYVQIPHNDK